MSSAFSALPVPLLPGQRWTQLQELVPHLAVSLVLEPEPSMDPAETSKDQGLLFLGVGRRKHCKHRSDVTWLLTKDNGFSLCFPSGVFVGGTTSANNLPSWVAETAVDVEDKELRVNVVFRLTSL